MLDRKITIENRLTDPSGKELRFCIRHIAPSELRFALRKERAIRRMPRPVVKPFRHRFRIIAKSVRRTNQERTVRPAIHEDIRRTKADVTIGSIRRARAHGAAKRFSCSASQLANVRPLSASWRRSGAGSQSSPWMR